MSNDKMYEKKKKIKKHGVLQSKEEPSSGWDTSVSMNLHQQEDHLTLF